MPKEESPFVVVVVAIVSVIVVVVFVVECLCLLSNLNGGKLILKGIWI